jgi:hypothetical protein
MGHATAYTVAGFPLWPGFHHRSGQVRSCGFCGGQSGTRAGFLQVCQFHLQILIPPTSPYSLIIDVIYSQY